MAQQRDAENTSSVDDIRIDDIDDGPMTDDDTTDDYRVIESTADQYDSKEDRKTRFRNRLRTGRQSRSQELDALPASSGIPKLDEWMDFFSRVMIRTATDFVIDMAFRGIDENLLSDREIGSIKLSDEERNRIAKPFAELAYKNKFTRKHGREIIATAGSFDALLQLGLWYVRMSRIAQKYRKIQNGEYVEPTFQMRTSRPAESPQPPAREQQEYVAPTGVNHDERTGSSTAQHNGHDRNWRPPIAGETIFNPGS